MLCNYITPKSIYKQKYMYYGVHYMVGNRIESLRVQQNCMDA